MTDQKQQIKDTLRITDYYQFSKTKGGANQYVCPFCESGTGPNGTGAFTYYPQTNTFNCFSCNKNGDIFRFIEELDHIDYVEAYNKACNVLGLESNLKATESHTTHENGNNGKEYQNSENTPRNASNELIKRKQVEEYNKTQIIPQAIESFKSDTEAINYLEQRGISFEIALAYKVGCRYEENEKCLIFPNSNLTSYSYRSIKGNIKKQCKVASKGLFNSHALYEEGTDYVYITEAPIDALSILEVNENALALYGCSSYKPLLEQLQKKPTKKTLVLCFDNDKVGQEEQEKLINELKTNSKTSGIKYTCFNWNNAPQGVKDMNEYLTTDKARFTDSLHEATADMNDISNYLKYSFLNDIQDNHDRKRINTGFTILDNITGGLQRGLYVVASISSLGKTTFIHQISDNIASTGTKVLYFSLEQSKNELVSKSLNRHYYETTHNPKQINSLQLRNYNAPIDYNALIESYSKRVKNNMKVIEGNFNFTFDNLTEYVTEYVNKGNKDLVVVVDYLQILDYNNDYKLSDKEKTDKVITGLKRLSRDLNICIIAISSLNRSSYTSPVSYEALKESGAIEYTADCVLGLQLSVLDSQEYQSKKTETEKREMAKNEKAQTPRKVKLVCLKNRYGISSFEDSFKYYCERDLFYEDTTSEDTKTKFKNVPIV